ncbi:MAG: hypothetical protein H6760_02500 [Candidatus Nomurabacteria bacterium]|nr:MAG: hypothetical protein H6760_02500 [Candidatus Nomurabacteria bacterium]
MRKLIGFFLILLGLGFLLQQLDLAWADNLPNFWWSLAIIAVGFYALNNNRRMWFGPALIILVGLLLFIDQLDLFAKSAWTLFWPIIIIVFGARIVMGKQWDGRMKEDQGSADASVVFSGIERKVTGHFKEGQSSAWFGGIKLDFREADLAEQSVLNASASFAGIDIIVPKNVRVVMNVTPILGGSEDKSQPDPNASKTLTIQGTAMFGGISVKN